MDARYPGNPQKTLTKSGVPIPKSLVTVTLRTSQSYDAAPRPFAPGVRRRGRFFARPMDRLFGLPRTNALAGAC